MYRVKKEVSKLSPTEKQYEINTLSSCGILEPLRKLLDSIPWHNPSTYLRLSWQVEIKARAQTRLNTKEPLIWRQLC